jgi:hypothetical protein
MRIEKALSRSQKWARANTAGDIVGSDAREEASGDED